MITHILASIGHPLQPFEQTSDVFRIFSRRGTGTTRNDVRPGWQALDVRVIAMGTIDEMLCHLILEGINGREPSFETMTGDANEIENDHRIINGRGRLVPEPESQKLIDHGMD